MNYKENPIAGMTWHRFSRITIDNPRPHLPSVTCVEQEVISLGGSKEVIQDIGNLYFPFDLAGEYDVLDPITNTPTGQRATGAQVYTLVYSLVMAEAKKRDEALAAQQQ